MAELPADTEVVSEDETDVVTNKGKRKIDEGYDPTDGAETPQKRTKAEGGRSFRQIKKQIKTKQFKLCIKTVDILVYVACRKRGRNGANQRSR